MSEENTKLKTKYQKLDVQVHVHKQKQTTRKMQYSSFQIWIAAATVPFLWCNDHTTITRGPGVDSKIRSKHNQMMNITNIANS